MKEKIDKEIQDDYHVVALHTNGNNDMVDYYLTLNDHPISVLKQEEHLYAYSAIPGNPTERAKKADFEKLKKIGVGGFSKVYRGN